MDKKLLISVLCLFVSIGMAFAQTVSLSGTVTDSGTGEPVVGAAVQLVGSNTVYSLTDNEGKFSLRVPSDGTITISCLGYIKSEVKVNGRSVINVKLQSDSHQLDDVIVVAYGTAKKESFTGSASTVKSESLQKRSVSNVTKAIEGLVAGVTTTSGSGQPGSGASIRIRGTGSINASSDPLIVVDGIPYGGAMSAINPNDIESLTVLKDASASALYGARAANGVIMITTKRGSEGKAVVNFKATVGFQSRSLKEYDMLGMKDYLEIFWEATKNDYMINGGYPEDIAKSLASQNYGNALGGDIYNPYKNYTFATLIDSETGKVKSDAVAAWDEDWMDELTNESALHQEYQIGVSGGNNKTKYAFSGNFLDDNGVLITTGFRRYSLRVNVDHTINDYIKMGASSSYAYTKSTSNQYSGTQTGNAWYTAQLMAPIYPVYLKDESGNDLLDENGKRQYDYGLEGRPIGSRFNVVGGLKDNDYSSISDSESLRAYAIFGGDSDKLGVFKGLSFTTNFGADIYNGRTSSYYDPYHGDGLATKGSISKTSSRTLSYTWNQILKYERTFDSFHFLAQGGHEFYNDESQYLSAERTGVYPGIKELAPATNVTDNNSYSNRYRMESYFGRLAADYADKYYIEATWRRDGSSRFHKDNRWGSFWSLGGSWRVSEESFMKDVSWVNNLTARLSYGQLGNDSIGSLYAWQSFYDLTWPNASNAGAIVSSLENRDISWESKGTLNAGIEGSFFNRFLDLTLEYYWSKTDDMLLNIPMATSTGFDGYDGNVGSMRNSGFEGTIRFNWFNTERFRLSSTFMAYLNRNKVLKLTTSSPTITSGNYIIEEGKAIYTFYMPKSAGVDPATGTQLYYAYEKDDDGNKIEGSEYITSEIAEATSSRYYMGSREADVAGSFGTDMQWGPIDFSFLTTFSIGGKTYDSVYGSIMEVWYAGQNWSKHILRRWQKPGDETDVPVVLLQSSRNSADRFLIDASYFAIKSIQLGYTLPQKWTGKIGVKSLRVFALGDNLALFSHLNGLNPQYNFTGGTDYSYTPTRTISFGVDINF